MKNSRQENFANLGHRQFACMKFSRIFQMAQVFSFPTVVSGQKSDHSGNKEQILACMKISRISRFREIHEHFMHANISCSTVHRQITADFYLHLMDIINHVAGWQYVWQRVSVGLPQSMFLPVKECVAVLIELNKKNVTGSCVGSDLLSELAC